MTLKVIGAGLGRTGTNSLKLALEQLLGEPCYHMFEAEQRPGDFDIWCKAAEGNPPVWREFLASFGAAVDAPACHFWEPLAAEYPDAKILLSLRDTEAWYESVARTILIGTRREPEGAFTQMERAIGRTTPIDLLKGSEAQLKQGYERHNHDVMSKVPADRLILWHPGDGWTPICEALCLPEPAQDFPHVNTTHQFRTGRL